MTTLATDVHVTTAARRAVLRTALTLLLVLLTFAVAPLQRASAFQLFGGRWNSITNLTVCVATSYGNDYYRWLDGLYFWNNTPTAFGYTTTCSSNVVGLLDANYTQVNWDGLAVLSPSSTSVPYNNAWGYLNYYYIQNYNAWKANSVSVHEIGHILGLAHEAGCVSMRDNTYSRYDVCGVVESTQDEINGVNTLY